MADELPSFSGDIFVEDGAEPTPVVDATVSEVENPAPAADVVVVAEPTAEEIAAKATEDAKKAEDDAAAAQLAEQKKLDEEGADAGDDPKAAFRGRLHGEDAHFARLRKANVPVAEAMKLAYPEKKEEQQEQPERKTAEQLRTELAEVRSTLKQRAADEGLYTEDIDALTVRQSELLAQIPFAEMSEREQREYAAQQRETAAETSFNAAVELFPALNDENSDLSIAVAKDWDAIAANPNDPRRAQEDLFETLAAKRAARLGIPSSKAVQAKAEPTAEEIAAKAAQDEAAAKANATKPEQGFTPVPAGGGRSTAPQQLSQAQKDAQVPVALAKAGSMDEVGSILSKDLWADNVEPSPFS